MAFRKILVPVNGSSRDSVALKTAFLLANQFSAHVEALFVRVDPSAMLPFSEMPISPDFAQELVDAAADVDLVSANAARRTLAETTAACGVKLVRAIQRCDCASASYSVVTGYLPQVLTNKARLCDVVVVPPIRERDNHDMIDSVSRVLVKAGCPILTTGSTPLETLGKKIAIGWDNGVACARAMMAALPILHGAEEIRLLNVNASPDADAGFDEALSYLGLHDLVAATQTVPRAEKPVSKVLLETAINAGCDLLVIGGYSRGRMTESLFGGVTEDMILNASLPVYMLH